MDKCKKCKNEIDPIEIYGDWFYCDFCKETHEYQPDSSKREDSIIPNENLDELVKQAKELGLY